MAFQEEQDKKAALEAEMQEKDAEVYFAKDVTDKIQHVLDIKQKERNLAIKKASDKCKLTDA